MEAVSSFETLELITHSTRYHIPDDWNIEDHLNNPEVGGRKLL
jgi:hypothetical protein